MRMGNAFSVTRISMRIPSQASYRRSATVHPKPPSTTFLADEWQIVPSFKVLVSSFPRGYIYKVGKSSWLNKEPHPVPPRREGERRLEICWRGAGTPASFLDSFLPSVRLSRLSFWGLKGLKGRKGTNALCYYGMREATNLPFVCPVCPLL